MLAAMAEGTKAELEPFVESILDTVEPLLHDSDPRVRFQVDCFVFVLFCFLLLFFGGLLLIASLPVSLSIADCLPACVSIYFCLSPCLCPCLSLSISDCVLVYL